ncbi:CPK2, partial [Symbiodinium natans]
MRGQRVLIKLFALACLLPLTWTNLQNYNGASQGTLSPVASSAAEEETGSKGQPKGAGKTKAAAPLLSAVRFVPPASVVSALQARAGRAQNAVLAAEEQHAGKRTLAQEANWLATQVAKTTKRLEADLRAKQDLGEAALQWHSQLAEHLSTNYAEVERLAGQLDADVKEALEILTPLVSTTTSDATQVLLHKGAQNAGPIWPPQVTGLLEMAANALRAVAALDPLGHNRAPAVGGGVPSVPTQTQGIGGHHARRQPPGLDGGIFPGAMLTSGSPTMVTESHRAQPPPVSGNRWTKRSQPLLEEDKRPVKSPRLTSMGTGTRGQTDTAMASTQDHGPLAGTPEAVPWPQESTGRTPTRPSRPTSSWMAPAHSAPVELDGSDGFSEPMSFLGGEEMEAPLSAVEEDWQQWQLSWITAWNTSVGQLMDMCGAAATAAQSNPVLQEVLPEPPHIDTEEVRNQCQSTLRSLQQHPWACGPEIATVVEDLMRCYSCLKSCPAAVPDCPQAVLLLGHILHAAVQDVMSYTPQCTEEWLFPQLVLGKHPDLAARLGASTPALPHHALLQTCACCIAVQGTEFLLAALSAGVLLGCVWTTLADPPHFKPLGQMAYDLPSGHQVLGLLLAAMGCGLALAPCLLMVVVAWLPIGVFLLGLLSPALPPQHTRREPWCRNKRTRETAVKQMKGCFFLCLLFSPVGASGLPKIHNPEHVRQEEGVVSMPDNNEADDSFMMQVAGQAHFNRIPAWSLSRVPRIRIRRELHPLEEVGARPLAMQELCTATYTRKLAVFHGGVAEGPEPILFRVDSRLFRPALDEAIVQALGISADAVDVLMLASPFDSVTREQYVLRPRAFPWYAQAVPVLVRGELDSFHVLQAARDEQCHDLVAAAALLTQMQSIPEAEQCQCVEGTFVADSQPLLQPRCDAIVWTPIALKQRLIEASAHSPYADMHSNQGPPSQTLLSCVIITANGIIHALTPAFAPDSETFRFLRGEFPELASLTMRRTRYALTDLPPTQFLAFCREELGRHSLVVDLRALDLGLLTLTVPRYISCSQILDVTARDHARILDTAAMHEHVMSGDYICLLHDQAVGPDVMLDVAGFDLLRAYRHTLVEVPIGSDSENAASRGASLAKALLIAAAPLRGPVGSMCLLLVVGASQALAGRAASAPPHRSGRLQRVPAPPCNLPNKASQATHAAIQRELLASGRLLTPVISPSPLGNDDPREVTFKLWHPGRVLTRCYPAQWPWFDVHADLLETVSALGRYVVLPAAATPDHRAVHMVAISSADTHSTILVARAGSWKCLDVDWRNPAADIHAWVESSDGTHSYRIDCAHRGRMRHGDVCVVVDTFQSASPTLLDISTLSLTMPVGCSWTRTIGRQVFPLLQAGQPHLWLPRVQGVTARDTAMDMLHTLRSPNPETTHLLDVPPYLLGLPGPILLAAPRGGMCTLVWLHDCHECVPHGVAFAVEGVFPNRADLLYALRELPGATATIWLRATEMFLLWGPSESLHSADNEAVVAEIVTASVDMRLLLSHSRTDSLSSAPHMGAQGMASMPGPQEARSSQISSLDSSLADPCIPTLGIPDEGTLHVVYCGSIQTSCVVPCPSRRMPWALIIGDEIRTACTDQTSWAEVATVADLSVLDLQGVAVVLDGFRWMWPEPITHLGHACGTLLRRTPNKDSRCYVESEHTLPPSPLQARSSCGGMRLAKWAQLVAWTASAPCTGRWLPIALLVNAAMAMVVPVDPTAARPPLMCVPPPGFLLFVDVLNCFLQHPQAEGTLLRIWRPCRGPAVYQFRQQVDLDNLSTWLREQGCRPTRDVFHLAHDSGPDAIDLLCTPPASGAWWILRDGSHRELLRPVCQLPDISEQLVTIDEGGQAHRLICGGQADLRPELLPGKRAAIGRSVPNWYGALAGTGLMMFSTSACWRLAPVMLATIIVVQPVSGQTIPASHPRRVWTFGLPEPVDLPTTARTVTAAVFESRSNPLDWDALFQWATSVFTLEQPLAQKFVLVLDKQIFRFGTIVSGLRHGQLLAIGEHTPSRSPMRYLNPWGEEEELPEIVRSDWGDTLLTGPGGQISLRPE